MFRRPVGGVLDGAFAAIKPRPLIVGNDVEQGVEQRLVTALGTQVADHFLPNVAQGIVFDQVGDLFDDQHPRQPGDPYPEKGLAGVGVTYKLVQHLYAEAGRAGEDRWAQDTERR